MEDRGTLWIGTLRKNEERKAKEVNGGKRKRMTKERRMS